MFTYIKTCVICTAIACLAQTRVIATEASLTDYCPNNADFVLVVDLGRLLTSKPAQDAMQQATLVELVKSIAFHRSADDRIKWSKVPFHEFIETTINKTEKLMIFHTKDRPGPVIAMQGDYDDDKLHKEIVRYCTDKNAEFSLQFKSNAKLYKVEGTSTVVIGKRYMMVIPYEFFEQSKTVDHILSVAARDAQGTTNNRCLAAIRRSYRDRGVTMAMAAEGKVIEEASNGLPAGALDNIEFMKATVLANDNGFAIETSFICDNIDGAQTAEAKIKEQINKIGAIVPKEIDKYFGREAVVDRDDKTVIASTTVSTVDIKLLIQRQSGTTSK